MKPAEKYPHVLGLLKGVDATAVAEHKFHDTRRWRFDFCILAHKIAIEVDGGVWSGGRHTRGAGFIADMEKLNEAAKLGWRVLRYTPQQIRKSDWLGDVKTCLSRQGDAPPMAIRAAMEEIGVNLISREKIRELKF